MSSSLCSLRDDVTPAAVDFVRRLVTDAGVFTTAEVELAVQLVAERLSQGPVSGYEFVFAEADGAPAGYACYGRIPCTTNAYDLYWLAVAPGSRRRGWGRWLLAETERRVAAAGGRRIYIDTSGTAEYAAARTFYERCGYRCAAILDDFYAPGDAKYIYLKELSRATS